MFTSLIMVDLDRWRRRIVSGFISKSSLRESSPHIDDSVPRPRLGGDGWYWSTVVCAVMRCLCIAAIELLINLVCEAARFGFVRN